jgi:hypothetical protein
MTAFAMNPVRALTLAMLVAGCGGATRDARPETPTQPRTRASISIPEPEPGSSPRVERASTLRIGVRLPLAPIAQAANALAPTLLAEDRHAGRFPTPGYQYRVTRGTIALRGSGDTVDWSVPVHLEATADIVGACRADLTATVSTRVRVAPDWRLSASSLPGPIAWQRRCRVIFGAIDVTGLIEPRVRDAQGSMARTVDAQLASRDLRATMTAAWSALGQRIALPEELGLWLRPSTLGISELRASPSDVAATLAIGVRPIVAQEAPSDAATSELPSGSPVDGAERGFTVYADVEVPLARIAAELDAPARAYLHALGAELRRVRVLGGRDAIYLGFELARPAAVTAWIRARVSLDRAQATLNVSDIAPTPETRDALAALGIDTGPIERAFRLGLSFPIAEHLDRIAARYREALLAPRRLDEHAELRLEVGTLELVDSYHTPTHLGLVLAISGSAELALSLP